jgi:fibronectin type 3 domain-containing protein
LLVGCSTKAPVPPAPVLPIPLKWNESTTVDSFNIYRNTTCSNYIKIGTSTITSFTDQSPVTGNNCYVVTAVRSGLESNYSNTFQQVE